MAEHCLHNIGAFSVSHSASPVNRWGVRKRLGGDTRRQMTKTDQRDIPCPWAYIQAQQYKGRGGGFRGVSHLLFRNWLCIGLAHGRECVIAFTSLLHACPLSLLPLVLCLLSHFLSWYTSFLAFTFPFLFRCPTEGRGKRARSCVVLRCLPGLIHKDKKLTESEKVKKCDS